MNAREQYLKTMRGEYRRAGKKEKTRLLNEARKRTRLNRKVLIRKLAHPEPAGGEKKRPARGVVYGADVVRVVVRLWVMFDCPCGQRLAPALRQEVDRLRQSGEVRCSQAIGQKLKRISAKTIDRLLAGERRTRQLRKNRNPAVHPLLYQKIPLKVASEWDTREVGNLQVDYVEHCGRSHGGDYVHTLSMAGIASGWWEGEPIPARTQKDTQAAMERIRQRVPFRIREIHPDNDGGLINQLVWDYCQKAGIRMSRSRPYRKNDNAWVEQRNWSRVRKMVGYPRYDTMPELLVLRELYGQLRLYKNFFQPTMKLKSKLRVKGKIHRQYEPALTPYRRLLESGQLTGKAQKELRQQYELLSVAGLRRKMDELRDRLFRMVENQPGSEGIKLRRHGVGISIQRWARSQVLHQLRKSR
ncbi:MAG: transposase family protein [Bryobacteraceae bacterium]